MTKIIDIKSKHQPDDSKNKSYKDQKFALSSILTSNNNSKVVQDIINGLELISRDELGNITAVDMKKIISLSKSGKFKNNGLVKELINTLNTGGSNQSKGLSDISTYLLHGDYKKHA